MLTWKDLESWEPVRDNKRGFKHTRFLTKAAGDKLPRLKTFQVCSILSAARRILLADRITNWKGFESRWPVRDNKLLDLPRLKSFPVCFELQ